MTFSEWMAVLIIVSGLIFGVGRAVFDHKYEHWTFIAVIWAFLYIIK